MKSEKTPHKILCEWGEQPLTEGCHLVPVSEANIRKIQADAMREAANMIVPDGNPHIAKLCILNRADAIEKGNQ